MGSVSKGDNPATIEWVLCSQILPAGVSVPFGVHDGRCAVYPSVFECQHPGLMAEVLEDVVFSLRIGALLLVVIGGFFLCRFCFKLPEGDILVPSMVPDSMSPSPVVGAGNAFAEALVAAGFQQTSYAPLTMDASDHGHETDNGVELSPMHT